MPPRDSSVTRPRADRRSFLGALFAVSAAAVTGLLAIPLARFSLHPLWQTTSEVQWSDVGAADELASVAAPIKLVVAVEQRDGWRKVVSRKPVYVIAGSEGQPRVMSSVCPHLGCSIGWSETRGQFLCPCHVGVFGSDGSLVSGPVPRGMDELETRVEDGRLQVRYQYFRQLVSTREVIA